MVVETQTYLCRRGWRDWVCIVIDSERDHTIVVDGPRSKREARAAARQAADQHAEQVRHDRHFGRT